jgi:hypothetical protein
LQVSAGGFSVSRNANLTRWSGQPSDWSLFELSIFEQARRSLKAQGVDVELDYGITDEGDPWLVFCSREIEVLCHFARIGDEYVASVPFNGGGMTGVVLSDMLADFFPLLRNPPRGQSMQGQLGILRGDGG